MLHICQLRGDNYRVRIGKDAASTNRRDLCVLSFRKLPDEERISKLQHPLSKSQVIIRSDCADTMGARLHTHPPGKMSTSGVVKEI